MLRCREIHAYASSLNVTSPEGEGELILSLITRIINSYQNKLVFFSYLEYKLSLISNDNIRYKECTVSEKQT